MDRRDPHDRLFLAGAPIGGLRLSDLVWWIAAAVAAAMAAAVAAVAGTWGDAASKIAAGVRVFLIIVSLEAVLVSVGISVSWLVAAPAMLAAMRRRRQERQRRGQGLCAQCGYDLRASAGRCPECGTPVDSDG